MQRNLFIIILLASSSLFAIENYSLDKVDRNKYSISSSSHFQSFKISSEASSNTVEASSDISIMAQSFSLNFFLNEKIALVSSYFVALILDIDAEVQGFDVGFQYYFLNNGTSKEVSFSGSYIETTPGFSPYLYLGASTRDYQFSNFSLRFQGISAAIGMDYHFMDDYFVRASGSFDYLLNNNVRTAQSLGASLGLGYKF